MADWYISNGSVPYRENFPELNESEKFDIRDKWVASETVNTFGGHRFLKLSYKLFIHWNGTAMTVETNIPEAFKRSTHLYVNNANFGKEVWMVINTEIPQCPFQCMMSFGGDIAKFYNTCSYIAPTFYNYRTSGTGSVTRKLDFTPDKLDSNFYSKSELNTLFYDDKKHIERPNNYAVEARVTFNTASGGSLPTDNAEVVVDIDIVFAIEEDNEERWQSMWELYPTHLTEYFYYDGTLPYRLDFPELNESRDAKHDWYIDDDIPFQSGFPELHESDIWVIDDDIPYRLDFPELLESSKPPSKIFWLQYAGYVPYRPWPGKIQIPNIPQTVEIPEIDWTKSMQQTFEYFTVDPKTWYDDTQLFQIISSNHSIDLTSDLRGSATISTNELLGENYIRTYMVCKQGRYTHRVCLGTYLYMTSDDSFNGIAHTYTMTGYTPLVELQESMPPIGFFIYGQIKKGDEAPLITDEIKKAILENTRCELETNVTIPKPLLNNFVAGTDDNWLTVVNNLLTASNEARYMLTIDEWGTLQLKNSPIVSNMQPTFVYNDSNSSILLPEVNTGDDLFQIPNTVELIFVGNTRFRPCRKIVKNEDEASPVSVQNRGREIVKRYTISNIAIPASSNPTQEMIEEMIENQAYTLLETASTIQKTISYSHGYCGTKVGDCVMINYERAGLSNVKAVITSQKINCTPGCQVDETASYTKKYFKRN